MTSQFHAAAVSNIGALLARIGLVCLAGCSSNRDAPLKNPAGASEAAPPPPVSASAYLNTRSDVAYVGDARCAKCHREISETYAAHPMGQSLRKMEARDADGFERDGPASFAAEGLTYMASFDGGQMVHAER